MARNIQTLAERLGAKIVAEVPETGGGAFGAARLGRIVGALQSRLIPSDGIRPGRPTDPGWVRHPKIPMSVTTEERLIRLAKKASTKDRKVSPMQLAAQILEEAIHSLPDA